eukprot:Hpha_TRINITY_DN22858_c0_g1::TRINITY_DN22858_c0_g1_i1::g.84222::m.84222/K13121/FRA10AC1; protein FRA10AC1
MSSPWERHQQLMHKFRASRQQPLLSDWDVLAREYRFIRKGEPGVDPDQWAERLAAVYHAKLFKEYALVNLVHFREGRVGMRWRTEAEVVSGLGQFSCGGLLPKPCGMRSRLSTLEVPFKYRERGEVEMALVKVRLCESCARKLRYRHDLKKGAPPPPREEAAAGRAPEEAGREQPRGSRGVGQESSEAARGSGDGQLDDDLPDVEIQRSTRAREERSPAGVDESVGLRKRKRGSGERRRNEGVDAAHSGTATETAAGDFWKNSLSRAPTLEEEFDSFLDDM